MVVRLANYIEIKSKLCNKHSVIIAEIYLQGGPKVTSQRFKLIAWPLIT